MLATPYLNSSPPKSPPKSPPDLLPNLLRNPSGGDLGGDLGGDGRRKVTLIPRYSIMQLYNLFRVIFDKF